MPQTPTSPGAETPSPALFESWGRYPTYSGKIVPINWQGDFPSAAAGIHNGALPVGMGRSYGDVCLLKDGNLLLTTGMNRLLDFDPATGLLTAESGITLAQILDFAVPRGFFLPVTPGTKYVTLGGAIANDIHGKNHEVAGSFGNHVPCFELVRSDGTRRLCSATENPDWFAATIGGMGLTGLITWAQLRLKPIVSRMIDYEGIQFHGIDEFLALKDQYKHVEYTVSWVDCVSTGKNFARGVFMAGDHSKVPGPLTQTPEPKLSLPFDLPRLPPQQHHRLHVQHCLLPQADEAPRHNARRTTSPSSTRSTRSCTGTAATAKTACSSSSTPSPGNSAKEGTIAILHEIAKLRPWHHFSPS